MAVVRYGEGLGDYVSPIDVVNMGALTLVGASATLVTLGDPNGNTVTVTGTGLSYRANGLWQGTATSITFQAPDGDVLFSMTGLSNSAAALMALIETDVSFAIAKLSGRGEIYGSSNGDILGGGAGKDIIAGMNGHDELRGGAGQDGFVFTPNKGVDTIVDFADTGARDDDIIYVRKARYEQMTMTQQEDDVLLTFGAAGALLILDQMVAEKGRDDFGFKLVALNE